jgi:hypothetical protein
VPREADRARSGARRTRPSCVGDREACADGQSGELIDRIAASAPVGKLLIVDLLGHVRVPFPGYRPDHRAPGSSSPQSTQHAAESGGP